jgi:hypothetical protein
MPEKQSFTQKNSNLIVKELDTHLISSAQIQFNLVEYKSRRRSELFKILYIGFIEYKI